MSNNVINLQRSVQNLTVAERVNEYKNVELSVTNEQFVRAKASGSLLPDVATWFRVFGSGQTIATQDGNDVYFYTGKATQYGIGIFSSPSEFKYADLEGRTIHFEADVIYGEGASGTVAINAYLRKERVATTNASIEIRRISVRNEAGHVTFDGEVGGKWFTSNYKDAYFGIAILCASGKASSWSVDNIKMTVSADKQSEILQAKCLWGTPDIARQILGTLSGLRYRPFTGTGARLNPAAEIGDNIVIDGDGYSVYSQTSNFNSEFVSNISAPYQEEVDHEFPYVPATERRFRREIKTLKAELNIQADQIEAKVSQESGNRAFGWSLNSNNFTVFSGGNEVLKVTSQGASINGHVVATSGEIGGCKIVDGVLQVASANIGSIHADQITAGVINLDRVPTLDFNHLGQGSVGEWQLLTDAVNGPKILAGSVSYKKTGDGVSGRLLQVDTNAGNIGGISERLNANWFICNNLRTNQIQFIPYGSRTVRYTLQVYDKKPSNGKYVIAIPTG